MNDHESRPDHNKSCATVLVVVLRFVQEGSRAWRKQNWKPDRQRRPRIARGTLICVSSPPSVATSTTSRFPNRSSMRPPFIRRIIYKTHYITLRLSNDTSYYPCFYSSFSFSSVSCLPQLSTLDICCAATRSLSVLWVLSSLLGRAAYLSHTLHKASTDAKGASRLALDIFSLVPSDALFLLSQLLTFRGSLVYLSLWVQSRRPIRYIPGVFDQVLPMQLRTGRSYEPYMYFSWQIRG